MQVSFSEVCKAADKLNGWEVVAISDLLTAGPDGTGYVLFEYVDANLGRRVCWGTAFFSKGTRPSERTNNYGILFESGNYGMDRAEAVADFAARMSRGV